MREEYGLDIGLDVLKYLRARKEPADLTELIEGAAKLENIENPWYVVYLTEFHINRERLEKDGLIEAVGRPWYKRYRITDKGSALYDSHSTVKPNNTQV